MFSTDRSRPVSWRFAECVTAATTITVWTPTTSTRINLLGLDISNTSGVSNTIVISFGNLAGQRIASYAMESSTTIFPRYTTMGGIESTMYDRTLHAIAKAVPVQITAYGYEIE